MLQARPLSCLHLELDRIDETARHNVLMYAFLESTQCPFVFETVSLPHGHLLDFAAIRARTTATSCAVAP